MADAELTAVFCYDAMVHFDPEVVKSYVSDTKRVLRPGGRALYHHSNFNKPEGMAYSATKHARNRMTQQEFIGYAKQAGLLVVESQVIRWGAEVELDCVTLLEKPA